MNGIIKKIGLVVMVLIVFGGSAWGGWFSFEPNVILLNGTSVAMELGDLEKENAYIKKGDMEQAKNLIKDSKVHIVKDEKFQTRVEYVDYEEREGSIFIRVKNESGSKLWANMAGLACKGEDGIQRGVTKEDLIKGEFVPL